MSHGTGAQAPRDRWSRSDGQDSQLHQLPPDRSGSGSDQSEAQAPEAWLVLQRAVQARLGNGWFGRVQQDGPRSAWDLQVLHLLQVARESNLDVTGYLPWNAAPSWNQALEPYYRVLLHELHGGGGFDAAEAGGLDAEVQAPSVADVLGAELMGELGLGGAPGVESLGGGGFTGGAFDAAAGLDDGLASVGMGLDGLVARRAQDGAEAGDPLTEHMHVLLERAGAGRSLTEDEQSFLERVHGQRFPHVRMHEGPEAHAAARAIAARAFTLGSDIYMGSAVGLDSPAGAELLAHEATHVKQAEQGRLPRPKGGGFEVSSPHQSYEREAEAIGHAGAALRQVELQSAGARPDPADLSWFTSRFGGLLSEGALDAVLSEGPEQVARGTAAQRARDIVRDVLVDQACSAWVAANSAMGTMAAGLNPAHATALGLLQQAVSTAFSQAIAAAQGGRLDGLSRLAGLTSVDAEAVISQLPVSAKLGGSMVEQEVRSLLSQLQPSAPTLRVLGQEIDVSGLVAGTGVAEAAASLVGQEQEPEAELVELDWAEAALEEAAAEQQAATEQQAPAGQDWQLADIYESVDPVGRAIVASLQGALPAPAPEAAPELVEQGLLRQLQGGLASSAAQLQAELEAWLDESGGAELSAERLAGLRGALAGLRAVGEAELSPSPEVLGSLQALGGRPSAEALGLAGARFAPYPDFGEKAGALASQTAPAAALSLPVGDLEASAPDLLSAESGAALGSELAGPSLGGEEAAGAATADAGPALFRKATPGNRGPDLAHPAVGKALSRQGAGVALPLGIRSALEAHLGVDLGEVRVHLGAEAHAAAKAVEAEAFATGQDIFFQDGAFDLGTAEGRELVAHEVAHTVQGQDAAAGGRRVSDPGEAAEVEADRVAQAFVAGEQLAADAALEGAELEAPEAGGPELEAPGAEEAAAPVVAEAAEGVLHRRPEDDEDQETDPHKLKERAEKEGEERELSEEEIEEEIRKAQQSGEENAEEKEEGEEESEEEKEEGEEESEEEKEEDEGKELAPPEGGTEPAAVDGPSGTGGGEPVPYATAKGGVVAKYAAEKAWHDQWKAGGEQTGVGMASGADMAMDAMLAGGLEGGMQAATNILVDTLLNKATKNIPYASGFIAMFDMARQGGPGPWLKNQFSNEAGTGIADVMGKGISGIANAEDWIDVLDGVINILDSLNKIIGLASTICMIVAAAGFIASFICPALIPFVALAAKWGLLLGEIYTLVGIGITAFRGISMLARAAQVARGNADPETQIKRAEKLRAQTAAFTAEYATRKANTARANKQKDAAAKKSGNKPAAGGTGGGSGSGQAQSGVKQRTTRKEKLLGGLSKLSTLATGGDVVKQTKTVGAHREHANAMTKTVVGATKDKGAGLKGEGGKQTIKAIQDQDAHFNQKHADIGYNAKSISDGAASRANKQFDKQASAGKVEAAKQKHADAQAAYDKAKQNLGKRNQDLDAAEARLRKAKAELEAAKIGKEVTDQHFKQPIGQQKRQVAAAEQVAKASAEKHRKAQTALDGEKAALDAKKRSLAAFKQVIDETENPPASLLRQYGERAKAVGEAEIAFNTNKGQVDQLRIQADYDRSNVAIQQKHLESLIQPGRDAKARLQDAQQGVHGAQQGVAGAKDGVAGAQQQQGAAKKLRGQTGQGLDDAQANANAANQQGSVPQRMKDIGSEIKSGGKDTIDGFKRENWWNNVDGTDVPASGYGHQGTGGVTGAGVDPAKDLLGKVPGISHAASAVAAGQEYVTDFADVSANASTDQDAAAAKQKFIEDSRARMDQSFSSMSSELQAPPVAQEGVLDEQAGIFDARTAEIERLQEQLQELEALKQENEKEKAALETGQQVMDGMLETADAEKQTNVQKRQAQDKLKQTADKQEQKGSQAKDKQAAKIGPVMSFVSGFARLMSIIPSRLLGSRRGAGNAGSQIGEGITKMGEGADTSKEKAAEDKAKAEEFAQKTDQADTVADEVKTENQTIRTGMDEDMAGAEEADSTMSEAESTATSRMGEAEGEKAAALAAWQGAVSTMNGWAATHHAARTGGQDTIDTTLDDVEQKLGEHQAAK